MCFFYLDNVIIFSMTLDDCLQCLCQVFAWIPSAGLKSKLSTSHLLQRCVNYLGHIVSEEGIHSDLAKTQVVDD